MSAFSTSVFKIFRELQDLHGFVPAKAMASKGFASLLRKETEDIFVYVFVHDGRPSHANCDVSVWVAPPDAPADSIGKLYVGYKVRIASEFEIDDDFFLKSQARIVRFLPCVPGMVPAIQSEMASPAFLSPRWPIYLLERHVYSELISSANLGDSLCVNALKCARRCAKGTDSLEKLVTASTIAVASLMEMGTLNNKAMKFFNGESELAGSAVAEVLYTHSLGELSGRSDTIRS